MSNVGPGALVCPKCHGAMRQYERSGITVDQCEECRGIFLDRGELEHVIQAEDVHTAGAAPAAAPQQGYPQQGYPPQGYPQQGYPPAQRPPGGLLGALFGEGGHHGGHHGHRGHH